MQRSQVRASGSENQPTIVGQAYYQYVTVPEWTASQYGIHSATLTWQRASP